MSDRKKKESGRAGASACGNPCRTPHAVVKVEESVLNDRVDQLPRRRRSA